MEINAITQEIVTVSISGTTDEMLEFVWELINIHNICEKSDCKVCRLMNKLEPFK